QHGEVGGGSSGDVFVARFDVHHPETDAPDLSGHPSADINGNDAVAVQADATAVENLRRDGGHAAAAAGHTRNTASEVEQPAAFQEEIALFRIGQREARKVHLLLVDFDLGKIGVHRRIGGEIGGDAVLGVEAAG